VEFSSDRELLQEQSTLCSRIVARRFALETETQDAMRKLLRGGQVSITRAFADNNVERVMLQSSLHADSVSHSVSSSSPPRVCRLIERSGRSGSSIRALNGGGSYGDHFATLGLSAAASKQEIKKAYRKLALQYHPDVCKGEHCALKFKQVNNAYEVALESEEQGVTDVGDDCLDGFMGATDDSWEDWEEWMGWEGAGASDYSSHVNTAYSF